MLPRLCLFCMHELCVCGGALLCFFAYKLADKCMGCWYLLLFVREKYEWCSVVRFDLLSFCTTKEK